MSSMPSVAPRAPPSRTRRPLYTSAAIALAIEAVLLAGVGAWLIRPHVSPRRPTEPMTIMLAPLPSAMPAPKKDAPKPVSKPAPAHAAAHVAHATRPKPQRQPQPQPTTPAPTPTPDATPTPPTTPTAAPTEPSPTPPSSAAVAPAPAPRPDASFAASLRAAIQAALRYPESARMQGTTGRTLVAFVYRDSAVSDIRVVASSGMGLLDHAAVAAVRDAQCPPPPHGMEGKSLAEQLWVDFTLGGNG